MINYIASATDEYAKNRVHAFKLIAAKLGVTCSELVTQDFVQFTEVVTIVGSDTPVALIIDHMKVIRDRRWTHEPRI